LQDSAGDTGKMEINKYGFCRYSNSFYNNNFPNFINMEQGNAAKYAGYCPGNKRHDIPSAGSSIGENIK
jgi:hypothetical protein